MAGARQAKRPAAEGPETYLAALGERVRAWRARRGMTRRQLARDSGVSERYLAQLESGHGNVSILLLRQIAAAMNMPVEDLLREGAEPPAERALLTQALRRLSPEQLDEARALIARRFGGTLAERRARIALIGLRGAGKSTLGAALAKRLKIPFVQLDRLVEEAAGMRLDEVFDLLGQPAFRRLERQALERALAEHPRAVLEAGGGVAAEAETYERLLASCFTVWLRARPEQHMARVAAQGDFRPMAGSREAMADLKRILEERETLYRKADAQLDTSALDVREAVDALAALVEA
jgi:XRE family transcriptional regulator, aerobic/anaerobic benzoate catabolism transcriptional regulator